MEVQKGRQGAHRPPSAGLGNGQKGHLAWGQLSWPTKEIGEIDLDFLDSVDLESEEPKQALSRGRQPRPPPSHYTQSPVTSHQDGNKVLPDGGLELRYLVPDH